MNPHPSKKQLQLFQDCALDDCEMENINAHVRVCPECQQLLDSLSPYGDDDASIDPNGPLRTRGLTTPSIHSETRGVPFPVISGYEIIEEIGRGGMGVVYKARQSKAGRIVALKTIISGVHASDTEVTRFRTEALAAAGLNHSGLVTVFEVGTCDGLPFFSQEYCAGGSLKQKLEGIPIPAAAAAHLVEKLARAIHVAHQAGIVHRDLKPANVLFQSCDKNGSINGETIAPMVAWFDAFLPKIVDFGLARKLEYSAGPTGTGAVLGTPSYMAPEQAASQSKDIGPPTDVYALGAILYELLTGRPPFNAPTALETIKQVVNDEPVQPRHLQPGIPKDLETICLKCLSKNPRFRYSTAEALADDIRRFVEHKAIRARPASVAERVTKWIRRNRMAAGLMAGLLVALAATISASLLWFRVNTAERTAQESQIASHLTRARLSLLHGQWSDTLASYELAERDGHPVTPRFQLDKIRARIALAQFDEALKELNFLAENPELGDQGALVDLYRGQLLLGSSDAEAKVLVRRAVATGQLPRAEKLCAQGMLASTSPEALDFFLQAIEQDPFQPEAYEMACSLLLLLGRLGESHAQAITAKALYPEYPQFRLIQALVKALEGNHEAAMRMLADAATVPSKYKEAVRALLDARHSAIQVSAPAVDTVKNALNLLAATPTGRTGREPNARPFLRIPFHLQSIIGKLVVLYAKTAGFSRMENASPEELAQLVEMHPEGTLIFLHGYRLFTEVRKQVKPHDDAAVPLLRETHTVMKRALDTPWIFPGRDRALEILASVAALLGTNLRVKPDIEFRGLALRYVQMRVRLEENIENLEFLRLAAQIAQLAGDLDLARLLLGRHEKVSPNDYRVLQLRKNRA